MEKYNLSTLFISEQETEINTLKEETIMLVNERNAGLDEALAEIERGENVVDSGEAFDMYVKHGVSFNKTQVYMTGENLLIQAFEAAADVIGLKSYTSNVIFVNEKTGKSTGDSEMSLKEFGIGSEDILTVYPDARVAAK